MLLLSSSKGVHVLSMENMKELTTKASVLLPAFIHQLSPYPLLIYVSQKDALFPVVLLLQRIMPILCLYQAGEGRNQGSDWKARAAHLGPAPVSSLWNVLTALEQLVCRHPDPASFGSSHRFGSSHQDSVESHTLLRYEDTSYSSASQTEIP